MKKLFIATLAVMISSASFAQYWQQQVNYKINVSLNDQANTMKGFEDLEYINNSPDKLDFIWFHLWENAYKNDSTAFAKQVLREKDGKSRLRKFKDRGFMDSLDFTVDGVKAKVEFDTANIDIIKLILPKTLLPGKKINIKTPFFVDIPEYISRSGHDDHSYMICQWYPKPAVYDHKGWHQFPYLEMGEYYAEFGNYDVTINLPSSYIVGASGVLQNADELKQYKNIGSNNVQSASRKNVVKYVAPAGAIKSLNYKGENIIDFAWFADKDFVIRYDTMLLGSGKIVDVFTYHHPDGNKNWVYSTDYVKSGARAYSSYLGEYAYPVVQAVEGPKNETSGGMEYPMITLITSPVASEELLDGVITHEVGHNWFMAMLASNERTHAWLDEGLNSYYEFRYEAEKNRSNSIFADDLPAYVREKSVEDFQTLIYNAMNQFPMQWPIDIPSAEFPNDEEYGVSTYIKTAIWLHKMERDFGKDKLDKAMQAYFNQWKFKHPYPEDLRASLEKSIGTDLTEYFEMLKKKGRL